MAEYLLIFVTLICGECDGLLVPYVCPVANFQYVAGVIDAPCKPRALSCKADLEFENGYATVRCTGPVSKGLFSDGFE